MFRRECRQGERYADGQNENALETTSLVYASKVKKVKGVYSFHGNPSWNYGVHLPYTESHSVSVTCHPTQVNAPRLNPSKTGRYPVLDLPTPEGRKAELTYVVGYIPRLFTCP